jgi:hypothetical protein
MTLTPLEIWEQTARGKKVRKRVENLKIRRAALSKPITAEQIIHQSQFLETVPYAGGFCWLYRRKAVSGRKGEYARMKHNGVLVQAHRFALALKLRCTLLDLEGSKAGHAPISICGGGRCCNPVHLTKEDTTARGAWQRSKDQEEVGTKSNRTKAQMRRLISFMYPKGLPAGQRLLVGRTLVVRDRRKTFTIRLD